MKVYLIVLDSFGIGNAPDSKEFGDYNSNTLKSVAGTKYLKIPNMISLGLGNIDGVIDIDKCEHPIGSYGRLVEISRGKDTTIGHWEIGGIVTKSPFPTYKNGFPQGIINKFKKATGRGVICNKVYSGTEVIKDYGKEHLKTGDLIVYTSADSVFQIAAHEDVIPPEKLYDYCKIAREILTGKHAVARVIARPFAGEEGSFYRTANRHDFSISPTDDTVLNVLQNNGIDTLSVGKIKDIFCSSGINEYVYTKSNKDGMDKTLEYSKKDFNGLCFVNLVDFDMLYGHRRDADGYAKALSEFDNWLGKFMTQIDDEDVIMITADHGCDPKYKGTDHTRECVPYLIYSKNLKCKNLNTIIGFGTVGCTICDMFGINNSLSGSSVFGVIKNE